MGDVEDVDLVQRARQGDGAAFGALVRPHVPAALRLARAITTSPTDAEDAVQEGLLRAYANLHRFDTASPVRPWLLRIVANAAKNDRRSGARRDRVTQRAGEMRIAMPADPQDRTVAVSEADVVLAALGRLDHRDRLVLAYRYFGGLGEAETAAALGWPVGTVKSRHARALERLRAQLGSEVLDG